MTKEKPLLLFIDQYGNRFRARTVKDLREQIGNGSSRVLKMYRDAATGGANHVGYVIGEHWLTAYAPHVFSNK